MKEDTKPSNIACSSFVPHRFKATQCGRCFKSHAQHRQFMKGNKNNYVKIMELHSNQNAESTSDEDAASQKTVLVNGRNIEDSGGGITTDYYTAKNMIKTEQTRQQVDETDAKPRRHITKKSVTRRNREAVARRSARENVVKLNIPIEQPEINDLSVTMDVNKNKESNGYNSASDNGMLDDDSGAMDVFRNNQNGNHIVEETHQDSSGSAGLQYLKAFRASRKSSIPVPKHLGNKDPRYDAARLQEFQEVAKNLRHVSDATVGLSEMNGNHEAVSRHVSAPCSDSLSPRLNQQDLEERQRMMEAKSSETLANTAFQTFSSHGKHGTLPRNLGMAVSRPSLLQGGSKHQRQTSDPDIYQSTEREEIQVVTMPSTESPNSRQVSSKKQVVTSKISSEIFFGASGDSKLKSPKVTANSESSFQSFLDLTDKPVVIVAADGSVSHYRGSAETSSESLEDRRGKRPSNLKNLAKPYKVVDVSQKPPVLSPEESSVSPQLPMSPSPRYRSHEEDLNIQLGQSPVSDVKMRSKDPLGKFPKRNVVLVDGIYSVKDGVQFSSEDASVTQTEHKDILSPLSNDGDSTLSFPILLSESESSDLGDKRRNSNSSNYKVPIFIGHKNYDNVGTVLSDRVLSSSDLSKDKSKPNGGEYLTPMPQKKENDKETPPVPPVRTSSEIQEHATDKTSASSTPKKYPKKPRRIPGNKEPNSNNSQSSSDSRWRSKTHPLPVDPIYAKINLETKKSNSSVTRSNTDVGRSKQKRLAPLPPNGESQDNVNSVPDSLPRGTPPPPPGRGSPDVSPSKPGKPLAPSPPTEGYLGIIYESLSGDPIRTGTITTPAVSMSPSKPHPVPANRVQTPTKQESGATHGRALSPHRRTSTKPKGQTPTKEPKSMTESKVLTSPPREVTSPLRAMSPPIPCSPNGVALLPDSSPFQGSPNGKESKSKRSKLPWKRKKRRDDRGSPEREFDSTQVEKWLEKVHQQNMEEDAQRHSMDRLDVINAYRGESTAFINQFDLQTPSLSTSPEQTGEDSDGSGIKSHHNLSSKRRAPKPPSGGRPASWMEGTQDSSLVGSTENVHVLKKSYSLSPQSRRRVNDSNNLVQYENIGVLRKKKSAPPKPERRRRNMTTGFEDLHSQRQSLSMELPTLTRQASSDPDLTSTIYETLIRDQPSTSSGVPLKSALKSPGSFETKTDADANAHPKRPVRIIAPEKHEPGPQEPDSVNVYSNIEIVQRGLGASNAKSSISSVIFTTDAETQCAIVAPVETAVVPGSKAEDLDAFESIFTMNRAALTRLATAAPRWGRVKWDDSSRRPWDNVGGSVNQACCTVSGGAFFRFVTLEKESEATAVMIGTDTNRALDLLHIAQCSQAISPHPNIFNISHASLESIPSQMLQTTNGQSKDSSLNSSHTEDRIESAVVMTDRVPVTNVMSYVNHNKELHEYLPEKYEHSVALLLLQLLNGLHHLQLHRVCLASLKLEHLLLVDSSLPGGGSVLVINHVISHLQCDIADGSSPPSHDMYSTPLKLSEKIAEFNLGILVYEFLHQPNPFAIKTSLITQSYEPQHLPAIPTRSKYSQGLTKLARGLLRKNPSERLTTNQAIGMLQCLLWGPPADLMDDVDSQDQNLRRWLVTEQARQVTNVSSYCIPGSGDSEGGFGLTDQLHCQFLSDTSVQGLLENMLILSQ
ncbi:inactive tyrosine-protein kinase PEAK1-like [Asterias rubens]|uniref:inactive tyrosine-protein kinase PEAK1-like n=1 Tax=Asterias rubens TaxID=7604 RepID=UPI0014550AE6|nr:inactive tyrosine-protein kinase PEAK1-like [Asterias rubens]XP_033624500.1 inactive tyrosine-protein kinase PEAK1-like [Asterias rubens]XP_033624501.1 inactive tyrosine-protein kinase PEAK1-like [Asterias rubens]XP_033624502.1 inactive tyrosine-protein kinase PEAK1-like [Asterias rubens]